MRQHLLAIAATVAAGTLALAASAGAASISLSPANTTVDDTYVFYGEPTQTHGSVGDMTGGWSTQGLLGYENLFTLVPPTSGGDAIVIDSASLTVTSSYVPADSLKAYRMTSDWMTQAAGSNQNNVTYNHRDVANTLGWAAGTFSSADYDAASPAVFAYSWGNYHPATVDVTAIVAAIYSSGQNYGFHLVSIDGAWTHQQEEGGVQQLDITYHYAPVPEPASLGLLTLGGLGLLARRRR